MKLLLLLFAILANTTIAYAGLERIIDGTHADLHEFPYQVSLQWNFNDGIRPEHSCSGSIINRNWILTAAHCVIPQQESGWMEVVAGVNNVVHEEGTAQRRNVSRVVHHKQYHGETFQNDIAVLLLSKPLHFNRAVAAVKLAPKDAIINQSVGDHAGWGSFSQHYDHISQQNLRKVVLPLHTVKQCRRVYNVDSSQVCAGGFPYGASCSGDSGGPLTVVPGDGRRLQIGVLSYGKTTCDIAAVSVFSSVMHFYDWIQRAIKS